MTAKASWYCSGLPKLWWWLIALIGLPLIFYFMISARQEPIENDISERIKQELTDKELSWWAEVNLDQRGRDVMLGGDAPDEASRDQAIQVAQGIHGVRVVEHDINIVPLKSPELSLETLDGKVMLKGILPSQADIDSAAAAAGAAFGVDNITNELNVGERLKSSDWIGKLATFLPVLATFKSPALDINDDGNKVSGIARTEESKGELLQQAKQLLGGTLEDGVTVTPLQQASLTTQMTAGKLTLSGLLPNQSAADMLISAASQRLGENNIINKLIISDDTNDATWLEQAKKLLGSLQNMDGSASIEGNALTLAGAATSYQAHINAVGSATTAIAGSDLQLNDNIAISIPAQPVAQFPVYQKPAPTSPSDFTAALSAGKILLSGNLAMQEEADALLSAANQRVGADNVTNQIRVDDDQIAPTWLQQAANLIGELPGQDGKISITNEQAAIHGTVNAYQQHINLLGRVQTALQDSGLALQDNILVEVPKPVATENAVFMPAPPKPSGDLLADVRNGELTLEGTLASQQEVEALVEAANTRVGSENVINLLEVSETRNPAQWLDNAKNLLLSLLDLKGAMSMDDHTAVFSGTAETNADYLDAIRNARNAMQGQQMAFQNNVELDKSRLEQLAREKAEKEEQERLAREKAEKEEQERLAQEKAEKEEQERLAREKAEKEEQERLAQEKAEKEEQERLAQEKAEKEEQERLAQEKAEKEEQERLVQEKAEKEEQERLAQEKAEKEEQERLAREKAEKEEQERLAREKAEKEEQERLAREKAEKEEQERLAREKAEKEEQERLAREKAEKEEQERLAREKAEKEEQERLACQSQLDEAMTGKKILFETNKADIKEESHELLNQLASIVSKCKDALGNQQVNISGHTDSDGEADYNIDLSLRRADAVRNYLQNAGIDTALLKANGFGEEKPIADNSTEEGKAQNRRITFEIRGK